MVRLAVFFYPETGALFSVKHPDRSAGAYAVRTRREESFHIFPCTDTSRRFDFYIFPMCFLKSAISAKEAPAVPNPVDVLI